MSRTEMMYELTAVLNLRHALDVCRRSYHFNSMSLEDQLGYRMSQLKDLLYEGLKKLQQEEATA